MPAQASPPFRRRPPDLPDGLVRRQRLVDLLRLRFERRLIAVVGGAGFGKTTLLAQAVLENRLDPFGTDRWLRITERDRITEHLLAGLASALGFADSDGADDEDAIVEGVWSLAPEPVALVLDDVHLLDGSPAWDVIDRLR